MPKGILWVSSRVIHPQHLTSADFCNWYENTHIQQVLSLPGMPSATRYEALVPQPDATAWSNEAPWLTIYSLPDICYKNAPAFRALDGQSEPDATLLNSVFKHAHFDTRFYEEVQCYEKLGTREEGRAATFLVSAALQPAPDHHSAFTTWYRDEYIAVLAQAPGYIRTRRYMLADAFVRTRPRTVPEYLALHEFDGYDLPWKELDASARTDWARRVLGGLVGREVEWYGVKREYGG